ncbi:MAG: penicillin-binding protein 2 [Rhizobiales bacterium]|nr:penicillin-binding protein 2 [Hyphomicrobiales bacterium]
MIGRRTNATPHGRMVLTGYDAIAKPRTRSMREAQEPRSPSERRIFMALTLFAVCFALVGARLVALAIVGADHGPRLASASELKPIHRPDIVDRNGIVLATDIATASLYADARYVIDPVDTARQLASVLTDINVEDLAAKLESGKAFVWIRRDLTPKQQYAVHYLGLPGLAFRDEQKRVYPNGATAANILGSVDVDNRGTAGIERYLDRAMGNGSAEVRPKFDQSSLAKLSIDLNVQHAMRDELAKAMVEFKAKAAVGIILDVHTGEVMALSSLPDFDPNNPMASSEDSRFNRATLGVYELGSVFKAVTLAAALDSGKVGLNEKFDATKPLHVARFTIHDFHAENRWLSLPEVFMHSSNIGTAKIALELGGEEHRDYLRKFGLLTRMPIELPESGTPLVPTRWTDLATITTSYGHGIAVTPLQVTAAMAAIVNGGTKVSPTFLRNENPEEGMRLISENVSMQMRGLLRLVVMDGTGRKADVQGYPVMGKTGTANKPYRGGYSQTKLITSFISAFPANNPRYSMLIMFDEPQPSKATYGYATAGWNAAPVTARVVARVAPLLGLMPVMEPDWDAPVRQAKLVSYEVNAGE